MSLLDDDELLFGNTSIVPIGKEGLPGFDEMICSNNSYDFYLGFKWSNEDFFRFVLMEEPFIKKYIENYSEDEFISSIEVRFSNSNSACHYNQEYDMQSDMGIYIVGTSNKNKNKEFTLFTFTFVYPFINLDELSIYAYRLFYNIYNDINRLKYFENIKTVNYDTYDMKNLEKFCKEYNI